MYPFEVQDSRHYRAVGQFYVNIFSNYVLNKSGLFSWILNYLLLNLITILTPAPGMTGPRLCLKHFSPSDIVVTEKAIKLKSSALPKGENPLSNDISNDILLVSRDGVQFPSNSTNLARRSPMIRNLLGDCPSEETTIIVDIESNILNTILELLNETTPTFPSSLYESVNEALEIFQIEQFVIIERSLPRTLFKERKRRIQASGTVKRLDGTKRTLVKLQMWLNMKTSILKRQRQRILLI